MPKLTEADVRFLLTSPLNDREAAKKVHCSYQAVSDVRRGASHKKFCPDIERRGSGSCDRCINWIKRHGVEDPYCGFGFPDPLEMGLWAARDCLQYQARSRSQSSSHSAKISSRSMRQKG